jgi:acyl-CoA dehydrogenase
MSGDGLGYMTEERRMIRDAAREFTMKEVPPVAVRWTARMRRFQCPSRDKLAEYFGITIQEAYGGLGLGIFEYCLICEQLSRGWMSVASIVARAQGGWIMKSMPEDMRKAYPSACGARRVPQCQRAVRSRTRAPIWPRSRAAQYWKAMSGF